MQNVDRSIFDRAPNLYNETSIWFEWGTATQSNGENLVKIQYCPATVKSERPPEDPDSVN